MEYLSISQVAENGSFPQEELMSCAQKDEFQEQ